MQIYAKSATKAAAPRLRGARRRSATPTEASNFAQQAGWWTQTSTTMNTLMVITIIITVIITIVVDVAFVELNNYYYCYLRAGPSEIWSSRRRERRRSDWLAYTCASLPARRCEWRPDSEAGGDGDFLQAACAGAAAAAAASIGAVAATVGATAALAGASDPLGAVTAPTRWLPAKQPVGRTRY